MPALTKFIELPTYTGFPVFLASNFAILVVNSTDDSYEQSGVERVCPGWHLCNCKS
jgi:hypothetical protein